MVSIVSSKVIVQVAIWGIVIAMFAVIAADLWIASRDLPDTSVSAAIIQIAQRYPILVLMAGICIGHLLWPSK